jgi:REP element-mobilizing transposase RayT
MTSQPFALLITWTCYGTWLPGDPRGYVSNTLKENWQYDPKQNTPDTPHTKDDPETYRRAKSLQKQPAVWLTKEQAVIVAQTMIDAAKKRGWHIARAAIMRNHVHVVIWDCPNDGSAVRRILKGTTQAALSDHAGTPRTWWTTGGSDRYKNDEQAVINAVNYVAKQEYVLVEVVDMRIVQSRGDEPRGSLCEGSA